MWKILRIIVLLLVLATVAQTAWLSRNVSWETPLRVAIYPINGDDSAATAAYLETLKDADIRGIETFFDEEGARHGLRLRQPVDVQLARPLAARPPPAPREAGAFASLLWSLQLRYWAWRNDAIPGPRPHVRLFVLYFDPATHGRLPHSTGLEKGRIGVIHAFASSEMAGSNQVVIAHELLHTLGATDKYDPASNAPRHPEGYAEPDRQPRHPQEFSEIMGGRIPVSATQAEIPASLERTLIGAMSAAEIGWKPGR